MSSRIRSIKLKMIWRVLGWAMIIAGVFMLLPILAVLTDTIDSYVRIDWPLVVAVKIDWLVWVLTIALIWGGIVVQGKGY